VTSGLGNWYGFDTSMAEGLDTIEQMSNVIDVVASRYDPSVANRILGLNVLRVFEAVTGG
jgi:microsomal dipeptidase-like Zn-dependent dipeptidase